MALANHRVRRFANLAALNDFIQNDADIASVITVTAGNDGGYILVFTVT